MPRLTGKRSNPTPAIAVLILAAAAAGISLEYFGYINVVPGFGRTIPYETVGRHSSDSAH